MRGNLLTLSLVLSLASFVTAAPLRVDLSQNGDIEPGWVDWNTGGTRLGNANVSRQFQNQADFDADFAIDFVGIDSRNRGQVADTVPLHDVLDDAFKRSNPFSMVIKGLDAGVYTMTTYHHDPAENVVNDDGTLNLTVKDADGTRLVADHLQQTWGPNPPVPASVTFEIHSDGVNDIVLTFEDNNDGIHNEAYLNGFEIDKAVEPTKASGPVPADGAIDIPLDVVLYWTPAESAPATNGHKVFFGKNLDDVTNDAAANMGVVTPPMFDTADLPAALEYGTTYYWRIDEADGAGGFSAGPVWSFTTEPYTYPILGASIVATASGQLNPTTTPRKTINGSGLSDDRHSTEMNYMWLVATEQSQPAWIQYEFDKVYCLQEMWVWNYNQDIEPIVGFGVKDALIEYSVDGAAWTPLEASTQFARAPGMAGYAHNTTVPFGYVPARYVRITAQSSWGGGSQYGLSEVRFYYLPVQAREPQPASGATGVGPEVVLNWRAGRQAAAHDVSLSASREQVEAGAAPTKTVSEPSFDAGTLQLDTTYFWRVDEVNGAQTYPVWTGDVWSFSTPEFIAVDNFDGYTDDEGSRVYEAWVDGWGTTNNGSQVGYADAPFAEQTIVRSGRQSMPLAYNHAGKSFSEAKRTFDAGQDWTAAGIQAMAIHFQGKPDNAAGKVYVKINNTKIVYDGDAADITTKKWVQWNIDLASVGASLKNVTSLTIGVESAGAGLIYVDDIQLHPTRCVADLRQPGADLNNDCVVDYLDLQIMAHDWLQGDSTLTTAAAGSMTNGLLAHYKLDGDVQDSSGSNLHGTLKGNPAYTPGVLGQALVFGGTDSVDCTNNVKWDVVTDKLTVAAWIRVDLFDVEYQPIVTKGDSSWRIARDSQNNGIQWRVNGPSPTFRINGETNANDGEWHHIAGTYDGATAWLFVDGKPEGSLATTGVAAKNTAKVFIGANAEQTARLWKGAIDDVRIYTRALTEAEVRYLADKTPGDGKLYLPVNSPAELSRGEPENKRSVNLKDYAELAGGWLDMQLWP